MAQITALQPYGVPGRTRTFTAKEQASLDFAFGNIIGTSSIQFSSIAITSLRFKSIVTTLWYGFEKITSVSLRFKSVVTTLLYGLKIASISLRFKSIAITLLYSLKITSVSLRFKSIAITLLYGFRKIIDILLLRFKSIVRKTLEFMGIDKWG